jgi:hypothetical protein
LIFWACFGFALGLLWYVLCTCFGKFYQSKIISFDYFLMLFGSNKKCIIFKIKQIFFGFSKIFLFLCVVAESIF